MFRWLFGIGARGLEALPLWERRALLRGIHKWVPAILPGEPADDPDAPLPDAAAAFGGTLVRRGEAVNDG